MVDITDSIKRELGQHFVLGFHGTDVSPEIETLIRDYYLGNVILMRRNVQSAAQVHAVAQKLQKIAKDAGHGQPLMIGTDQENGLVSAFSHSTSGHGAAGTQFPGAMALAATRSPELAERVSFATGRELKHAGINWAYSPVADVNSDSRNPVIGVRSFGDDPQKVSEYVAAVSRGLTQAGVAPSAKHFPGHGDTHVDSHLALPVIPKAKSELAETELVPFAAISDSVATIMTGHMALPKVTGDDAPASLSRIATHDLLRDDLQYQGVVVTDCLEMEAVAARPGGVSTASVEALRAGADIVMICHTFARHVGSFEAVYSAITSGQLDLAELRESGKRIAALKGKFAGSWEQALGTSFDMDKWLDIKAESEVLSRQAYLASVAVLQDKQSNLPLTQRGGIVVFSPQRESLNLAVDDAEGVLRTADGKIRNTAGPSYLSWAAFVEKYADAVTHIVYAPDEPLTAEQRDLVLTASTVLFATRNADRSTWQYDFLRQVLTAWPHGYKRLVVLSSCAPYDFLSIPEADDLAKVTVVASFEFTAQAMTAATEAIFGQEWPVGRAPVSKNRSQ
ncbi:glycoside hydrolase [Dentipellis sp. KUC8613]|nr:glycoside hydrolase [Dentipellis sp. KUC8613]